MDTSKPKVIQDIQGLFLYGSFEVEPGPGRPRISQNSAHRWLPGCALCHVAEAAPLLMFPPVEHQQTVLLFKCHSPSDKI